MRAYMLSCPMRALSCAQTMERLAATDWGEPPVLVLDETAHPRRQERQLQAAHRLLERAVDDEAEVLLFLEDDLEFNRHLRHNLSVWSPVRELAPAGVLFGSLYNPNVHAQSGGDSACASVDPGAVYGSQAFVLSRATARYLVEHWHEVEGMQDIKMSRLAARLGPVLYHVPSLVQHLGVESTWGGPAHVACDYDAEWRAAAAAPRKALITFGTGRHAELLALSMPTFAAYAERHGYEIVVGTGEEAAGRPPPWAKVPLLRRTLADHDLALWLDADAAVVDAELDIADVLEPEAFQALAEHETPQGRTPNTGVWLMRAGDDARAFLDAVWAETTVIQHPWWENAAVCTALGYRLEPPCRHIEVTRFTRGTQLLTADWNSIPHDRSDAPRIVHFAGEPIGERRAALADALATPRAGETWTVAVERMRPVPGWLDEAEARVLFDAALSAGGGSIVEVGSMWGRSTVVLATAAAAGGGRVFAIDPHDGVVSALDGGVMRFDPTWDAFRQSLAASGVTDVVTPIRARSLDTRWTDPIALLFVDGMHDYDNVAADTNHFLPWLGPGARIAFHDYGTHFPGVRRFVDHLLTGDGFTVVAAAGSMVVIERR